MPAEPDVLITDLLTDLGYRSQHARDLAMTALVDTKLTSGRKLRIAMAKLDAVKDALEKRFVVVCTGATCRAEAKHDLRARVDASRPTDCSICHGSANETAIDSAIRALANHQLRRLVVVGGSPATHEELRALSDKRLDLRLITGTDRRTGNDAKADLAWADVIVIWGSTQLDHKTSKLYTTAGSAKVVTCSKRGVAALAETLIEFTVRR